MTQESRASDESFSIFVLAVFKHEVAKRIIARNATPISYFAWQTLVEYVRTRRVCGKRNVDDKSAQSSREVCSLVPVASRRPPLVSTDTFGVTHVSAHAAHFTYGDPIIVSVRSRYAGSLYCRSIYYNIASEKRTAESSSAYQRVKGLRLCRGPSKTEFQLV